MSNAFPQGLEPAHLWQHFQMICSVPHGSGNEAALRDKLRAWAETQGFTHQVDEVGNLLIRVPASPGMEDRAPTVIQGHIDMVCEKNADVDFDFATDSIQVIQEGDFLTAQGTTLGADNGVGVAAGMAIATDPEAKHGPLELLCTISEETGMDGAFGLKPGFVTAKRMLNLDSEEEGAIYVGCAGGGDVLSRFTIDAEPCPEGKEWYRMEVKGLVGGHSGLDIIKNRANAIKCLARVLLALDHAEIDHQISRIDGGSMRNAIPREATCCGCLAPEHVKQFKEIVAQVEEELKTEFRTTDPDLQISVETHPNSSYTRAFSPDFTRQITLALVANPSSVIAISQDVPGLVETSNNLGVIRTQDDVVEIVNCTRSTKTSALDALRHTIAAAHRMAGAEIIMEPSYPGWQPNMESALLQQALKVHQSLFGPAEVKAIHAGLECGIIGHIYPDMEMISFGPDIIGAHSPDERVSIPSTQHFYAFLKALLAALD